MPDAGARHSAPILLRSLKVLCNKEENLSYCCSVITIDWQCNMHWMHEIFTGQRNQVCCHERHLEVFSSGSLPGRAWVWHSRHNWRHLDRSVLHPFFATFLAPKISIPNCLPSNIPVLPLLSQCPMCTLLASKKNLKADNGHLSTAVNPPERAAHPPPSHRLPTFANALNCQDDRSAVIDFSAAGF